MPVCNFIRVCGGQYFFLSDVEDVRPPHAKGFESTDVHYFNWPSGGYSFVEVGGSNGTCAQQGGDGG